MGQWVKNVFPKILTGLLLVPEILELSNVIFRMYSFKIWCRQISMECSVFKRKFEWQPGLSIYGLVSCD